MDEARLRLVLEWQTKARHDLAAARLLAGAGSDGLLDTAAYHCQQAAEKMLKGFLCAHDAPIPKSHDVVALVNDCSLYQPSLSELIPLAALLAPLATLYRYPGAGEPDADEVREALEAAEAFVTQLAVAPEGKECSE